MIQAKENPIDRSRFLLHLNDRKQRQKALRKEKLRKEAVLPESSRRRARSTSKRSKWKPPRNGISRVSKERTKESCSERENCFSMHRKAASQTRLMTERHGRVSLHSLELNVQKLGCISHGLAPFFRRFSGGPTKDRQWIPENRAPTALFSSR